MKSLCRQRGLWLGIATEVSVSGNAASENGYEVPLFVVLRDVALISRELVTSEWGVGNGEWGVREKTLSPTFQRSLHAGRGALKE